MKKIILWTFVLAARALYGQNSDGAELDLLKAPVSPASNLLGFAQSDIDKPTDVSALMLSLQSASSNFTSLPSSYAVDIAPYWLFKKSALGDITTDGLKPSHGKNVWAQTLVFSFAIKNTDSTELTLNQGSTYGAFGFKFSICRGDYDSKTVAALGKIRTLQKAKLVILGKEKKDFTAATSEEIKALETKRKTIWAGFDTSDNSPENNTLFLTLTKKDSLAGVEITKKKMAQLAFNNIKARIAGLRSKASPTPTEIEELAALEAELAEGNESIELVKSAEMTALDEKIKAIASEFQTARVGFTFDIAGGISSEFINRNIGSAKINNAGIWATIGHTSEEAGSFLALARFLYNPERIFAIGDAPNTLEDVTTFDAGVRYIYGASQSKFNASLEAIYRSVFAEESIDPSWRLVLNADYAIFKNQKLTFSFGRNFDGTTTKDGNLIAALGYVTGFGNKR